MTSNPSVSRRLQFILLLLMLSDLLALLAELSFGGPLLKATGGKLSGLVAVHGSLGGSALVPLALYFYAFVRGPLRHRNILWLAVLEQAAIVLFGVYHLAVHDVKVEGAILPMAVAGGLVVLILINLPRGQVAT